MTTPERNILERIEEKLDKNIQTTERIVSVLAGDEFNKKGMIEDVQELKEKQQKRSNESWIIRGVAGLLLALITFWDKFKELFT